MLDLGRTGDRRAHRLAAGEVEVFCFGASADVVGGRSSITNERMPSRSSSSADAGPAVIL